MILYLTMCVNYYYLRLMIMMTMMMTTVVVVLGINGKENLIFAIK